jgi:hypothetical protein
MNYFLQMLLPVVWVSWAVEQPLDSIQREAAMRLLTWYEERTFWRYLYNEADGSLRRIPRVDTVR